MLPHKLTIITVLFLALSFNGMAQKKVVKLEINSTAPKAEPVKIEQINGQDVLRVANSNDTIRIPLADDTWAQIEKLMHSDVATGLHLKDVDGTDVNLLRVTKNRKQGIYLRNKKRTSITILDEEITPVMSLSKDANNK